MYNINVWYVYLFAHFFVFFRNQVNHLVKYDPDPMHSFDNLHKSNVNIELVK